MDEEVERQAAALRNALPAPSAEQVFAVVNFAGGQCTGSPIAPNLVLTARHCIGDTNEISNRVSCDETLFVDPDSAGAMFVLTTPTITNDVGDYRRVRSVRLLPGDDHRVCGRDVALLELEKPIEAIDPLIPRVDAPPVAGEPYTAYGYGDDEGDEGAGVRRVLFDREVVCVGTDCRDRGVLDTEFMGTNGVCGGDSGGPALDASGRVLGVVSRGFPGCMSPIYGSVPAFGDFLKTEALWAAEQGGYEPPSWAFGYSTDPKFHHRVGGRCGEGNDCASGICGHQSLCTRECASDGPCPAGYACDGGLGYCVAEHDPGPESNCSYAARRGATGAGLWLGVLVVVAAARTRRSARARRVRAGV